MTMFRQMSRNRDAHESIQVRPEFQRRTGPPVLDAALDAGLNLAHSCKSGNLRRLPCAAAERRGRLSERPPLGLRTSRNRRKAILLCQAHARTDLDTRTVRGPARRSKRSIKRLPCRIDRAEHSSHDVMGLFLRLPAAAERSISARAIYRLSCCPAAGGAASRSPRRRTTRSCSNCTCAASRAANSPRASSPPTAARRLLAIEGPVRAFRLSAARGADAGEGAGDAPMLLRRRRHRSRAA